MWGGSPPFLSGITGRNVVVGIVDSGLDLTHGDFKTSTGGTRVKYAWDQTWTGTKPVGFNYGAEYTESMINSGQASSFRDNDGHGTHVTGIAAGNGRATGNGQPDYRYVGIAPEADLVIVKTNFTDAGVIDGVNYIFQKAASLGKAAVVNLSVGTQKGGHDGSSALDVAISALAGSGKLVTAAAGNYGNVGVHKRINLAAGGNATVPIIVPAYTPTTVAPENLFVEGWYNSPSTVLQVKLRSPSGYESGWIGVGGSSGYITVGDGSYIVDNGLITNSRGAKLISISIYRASTTTPHPAAGTWSLYVNRVGGTSGICDFWVSSWKLSTTVSPSFGSPDFAMSITSPATGDNVIATGAYSTKSQWTNGSGGTSSYGSVPLKSVADFSSHGPRRDGTRKPDIVAPGYGIAAALSTTAPTSNTNKVLDQVHYMRIGTSQANAHTTGVLALLLQQNRWLTPQSARQELTARADVDSYTGSVPNDLYGYGKLDMIATVSGVELVPPAVFHFAGPYPNPAVDRATFEFTLSNADITDTKEAVSIRIYDLSGRLVADTEQPAEAGRHEWTWTGESTNGGGVAGGVYFARLQVGSRASAIKFVKLRD
jgi:subtilisin family serine protease